MSYDRYSSEAFNNLRPISYGTWTATNAASCPGSGNACCGGNNNPCCGAENNPCCNTGGSCSGAGNGGGDSGGVLLPDKVISKPQVVMSSSGGGVGPLPLISTSLSEPLNVVSTSVNTCCVGNTSNLLMFTSIINLPAALAFTLNFQILRSSCTGGSVNIGPTFTFAEAVSLIGAEAFSFQFVDNNVAPGNYTYSIQLGTGTLVASAGVTVTNAILTVLAVSSKGC